MTRAPFRRILRGGEHGLDVEGVGRGLARGGYLSGLRLFMSKLPGFRQTYNASKQSGVNKIRRKQGRPQNGVYDLACHRHLESIDAFDARAVFLMEHYQDPPELVFPFPVDVDVTICQGPHETAGLPGSWAIDFCAKPGSGVVAVEHGTITKLSGHDPLDDAADAAGIYGWSVHYVTPKGYHYFVTHFGWRPPELHVGLAVAPGDLIGTVGNQKYRPDHSHYSVSSPLGPSDAKKRISAVASAPRIR